MSRRRRRRHPNWPARWIIGTLLAGAIAYLTIPGSLEHQRLEAVGLKPSYGQLVVQQSARLLGTAWFFFVGASIGSFLNVVVWRVPRGRSLFGRSHCPWCAVQIPGRDNLPVLGWVLLRGRCRTCRLPISPRYPLVELGMGLLFLFVLGVELLSGGSSLPVREVASRQGFFEVVYTPQAELLGLYAFHMWMLAHLVAWTLIQRDGLKVPLRYVAFVLVSALVAGIWFPWLHPVPALFGPLAGFARLMPWFNRALTGVAGFVFGALLGNEFDMARSARRPQATWFLGLAGAQLGWQAAFGIALIATFLQLGSMIWRRLTQPRHEWPLSAAISIATLSQLIFWRSTAEIPWWPGPDASLRAIAIAGIVIVAIQFLIRYSHRREPRVAAATE